ncbi:anchored repeat-type ABC transporter ATP-binding subunit [Micromonospora sp. 067-2]|uniref:anchored repeat-type ABC transporter ATP-binding subunit n=1 Tax=Micromonospora sp. 067-2 TaxID=2789270 RepID=UPI003979792A
MRALEIEQLDVDLGGRPVLRDVRLHLERGELVGLLGPNGAGKTTLLRAALALIRIRGGRVLVEGKQARPGRSAIGYVPQRHEFTWDFPISVEQAVLSGRTGRIGLLRRPAVDDRRAVGEALDRVQLTQLQRRPVGELSGGQRQRVLVARALALAPGILLLDEPFTGLDMPTQELLGDLFTSLAGEGRAVLMTTHDLVAAVESCTRLVLLNGRIIADGPPADVQDVELWRRTFGVSASSPLLKLIKAA